MLESVKVAREMDRDTLINVARTSLRTKVNAKVADILTEVRGSLCVQLRPQICSDFALVTIPARRQGMEMRKIACDHLNGVSSIPDSTKLGLIKGQDFPVEHAPGPP